MICLTVSLDMIIYSLGNFVSPKHLRGVNDLSCHMFIRHVQSELVPMILVCAVSVMYL